MKRAALVVAVLALGCTEQERARMYGGEAKTDLAPCQKLVVVTWKGNDLWFLTRPMVEGERAEAYRFQEDSSFGVMEGTVHIHEHYGPDCM